MQGPRPQASPRPLWGGHKEGVNDSVLQGDAVGPPGGSRHSSHGGLPSGLSRSWTPSLATFAQEEYGSHWPALDKHGAAPGLTPRVGPVLRVGRGPGDCTGRKNVEPVLWGPESRPWW